MKKGKSGVLVILCLFFVAGILAMKILSGIGGERSYAGLTLKEVFPDPAVRQLADAAAGGNTAEINKLIARGFNVNAAGKYGITPLYWALLVYTETADPRYVNFPSKAADARCYDGFADLLEKGANPNIQIKGEGLDNVMYSAANASDPRFLEAAIKAGGDVNLVSVRGTPIFGAIMGLNQTNVHLLVAKGANLNVQQSDQFRETPMMAAADLGNYEDVYYFLTHGADPTLQRASGQTIFGNIIGDAGRLRPQAEMWREKVIAWLKERGFKPHASDLKNLPPPGPGIIKNYIYNEPQ